MKVTLPIFACLFAVAAAVGPAAQAQLPTASPIGGPAARKPAATAAPAPSGDEVLKRVLASVDAQPSIAARLRYRVELMGRAAEGTGVYLQQGRGPDRQLRLEMSLQHGGFTSRIWQVADGTTLWTAEELAGARSLGRVDIARLRRARPKSPGGAPNPTGWMALGGLPKMLAGLESAFEFAPPSESRLDDVPVLTLAGRWEPARLRDILPDQKEAIDAGRPVNFGKLSPQLPTSVVLHVGRDDLFPYRLEYWRASSSADDDNAAAGAGRMMVVMELYEVRVGNPIDPTQFAFHPPEDMKPADRTGEMLDKLGLEEALPAGAKKKSPHRR